MAQATLAAAAVADSYQDAFTVGPYPGLMDGADIRVERADVLFEVSQGDQEGGSGASPWLEGTEYLQRPGSRHVGNINGIRFRNAVAGIQAIVTAYPSGRGWPQLGPVIPIPATGVGDNLIPPSLVLGTQIGPFDLGDWPALMLGVEGRTRAGRLRALYPAGDLGQPQAVLHTAANMIGLLVVPNIGPTVNLIPDTASIGPGLPAFYAAPCGFNKQPPPQAGFGSSVIAQTGLIAVGAGANVTTLGVPYKGVAQSVIQTGAGGPYTITLDALDYLGAIQERLLEIQAMAANSAQTIEHPTVAAPMQMGVFNGGGVAGAFAWHCVVKEADA